MKKNLLLIGLVLTLSLSASAQYKGFTFGFKAGPNLGWAGSATHTATRENPAVRAGGDLGFIAEYYFTDNYAIVTGINVSFMGGHYSFDGGMMTDDSIPTFGHVNVNRVYKTTAYELPIMLRLVTNDLGAYPIRVYAQIGGGVGYSHKYLYKDGIDGSDISESWEKEYKFEYSKFHLTMRVGAGVEYAIDDQLRVFGGFYYSRDCLNNINWIKCGYYVDGDGNYCLDPEGEKIKREPKLSLLQNRIGFEVGVLF